MSRSQRAQLLLLLSLVPGLAAGCVAPASTGDTPAVVTTQEQSPAEVDSAVRTTFERYRQALTIRDGDAAALLVSRSTIDYYGQVAALAASGGPDEIGARSLIDRFTVAALRVRLPPAEIAALDGRGLFVYAVEAGLIDASSLADNTLGSVRTAGERAFAALVVRGTPSPVDYEFVRAGDAWVLDFVPTLAIANTALQQTAARAGLAEDEFIFQVVESLTGRRVDESVFARP